MTHKDAPPITPEQGRMEAFYRARMTPRGIVCGWSRDKHGEYQAEFARDAWAAWQEAKCEDAALPKPHCEFVDLNPGAPASFSDESFRRFVRAYKIASVEAMSAAEGLTAEGVDRSIEAGLRAAFMEAVIYVVQQPGEPVRMLLFCPACNAQHIDAPDESTGWTNPPHRSHLCHPCGYIWRPADVPTTGVAAITTRGARDGNLSDPPASWDTRALHVSRLFTGENETQRRARLQIAVLEAMKWAAAIARQQPVVDGGK